MSQETLDIMTRASQASRLRIINTDVIVPNAAGSPSAPVKSTYVLKYQGTGAFVPNALLVNCCANDGSILNPSPTTFTFDVTDQNLKYLLDGRELYNNQSSGAANNLLNYWDNFDSFNGLTSGQWWYLDITSFSANIAFFQACAIGTEFLYDTSNVKSGAQRQAQ